MNWWISIEDGLPEEENLVLAYHDKLECYDLVTLSRIGGMVMWHGDRVSTWRGPDSSYGKPTHWMSVPMPPDYDSNQYKRSMRHEKRNINMSML